MPAQSDSLILDNLGQQPRINRLYTQLTFCFSVDTDDEDLLSRISGNLNSALEKLSESFPWTTGNTVKRDGVFQIEDFGRNVQVVYKDLRKDEGIPDWKSLSNSRFPYKWLHEEAVAPRKTLSDEYQLNAGLPVFLVRLNIIDGGLLFCFNAQHGAMDMAGMVQVIRLLAKACRGEAYDSEEIEVGNMDRGNSVPLLEDHDLRTNEKISSASADNEAKSRQEGGEQAGDSSLVWAYFAFTSRTLSELKALAMEDVTEGEFVSTDDVLSAFIWQAISRARMSQEKHNGIGSNTTLSRNVDMRRHFNLPPAYPGLCVDFTSHTKPVSGLIQEALGTIASRLRRSLGDIAKLKWQTQLQATRSVRDAGDGHKSSKSASKPANEVRLSSWAKEKCYDLDFGEPLGKPVAVRRPSFVDGARAGLVYFLPKSNDGEIVVGICLNSEDMSTLKSDIHMSDNSVHIG